MRWNGLSGKGCLKKAVIAAAATVLLGTGMCAWGSEVRWEDLETELAASPLEGRFVVIRELGLKMWLPEDMEEAALDDSLAQAGYLHYYQSEDEENTVAVTYVDMNGIRLPEYEAMVEQAGGTKIEEIDLNGLGAVSYRLESSDLLAVSFVTEKGYVAEFLFSPVSDEEFAGMAHFISGSIMSAERG